MIAIFCCKVCLLIDAICVIERYLPADREGFDRDPPLQSHIYRHLMIAGEAAWSLSDPLKQTNTHVPWRQIEGMRHIMVHDYLKVNWTPRLRNRPRSRARLQTPSPGDSRLTPAVSQSMTRDRG
jgi:hypothetical protein